ncbi:unnamed protein product [Hydatigera taeniaeformis]|uniref:Transcriptional regulator n=1 Tax=Hydatigena taeniaeformis TaxID=6205 RepID=A0A0R3WRW9_HYDTA|nr:unnamed protein product [Hydatigera taeniaeformis]
MYVCSATLILHASQQRGNENVRLRFGILKTEKRELHFTSLLFDGDAVSV